MATGRDVHVGKDMFARAGGHMATGRAVMAERTCVS
jgi:hypothetical protein